MRKRSKRIKLQKILFPVFVILVIIPTFFIDGNNYEPTTQSYPNAETHKDEEQSSDHTNTNVLQNSDADTTPSDETSIATSNRQTILLSDPKVETRRLTAGTIYSLSTDRLQKDTIYTIDISNYEFSDFALVWPSGDLKYSLTNSNSENEFHSVPIDDDIQEFEENITSNLISVDEKSYNFINIISNSDLLTLRIDLINPTPSDTLSSSRNVSATGTYNRDSGAKYTTLNIISRDQWGASFSPDIDDPSRFTWEPAYHPVSRIVVHHTAGSNYPSDPAAVVRSIYLYHAETRGWGDIGYNYLIDHRGNIYEGKAGGDEVFAYHAFTEANAMSIGISLLGDFTYYNPTYAAQSSLIKLMAEKAAFYNFDLKYSNGNLGKWLDSSYTVFGHRDTWFWCYEGHSSDYRCPSGDQWIINATACPGDKLRNLLSSTLTYQAQSYKNSHFSTMKSVISKVESKMSNPHEQDKILVVFDLPETATENEVLSLIPSYSGITDIYIEKNRATILVRDWNNGGIIPPSGWDGYNAPGTFFPVAEGTDDRLETLLKLFVLDPKIKSADLNYYKDLRKYENSQ
ncbi:N-acetylmuramoyl-L-alanine amidase [Candidatus Dojkabacteria bacterium]|nr:N-acetylmuramoyl-L-alanine amidase [Candidatus Dojkabacteria bacterium]